MARIFITGSADGLGQLAAKELIALGHDVVLHARNEKRASETLQSVAGATAIVTANLASIDETIALATKVNALGQFDAVIHNAGVYRVPAKDLFAVNTLAPYILTALIQQPKRLIYLSSGMHREGHAKLDHFKTGINAITYSDTKLHVLMLCKAIARKWPAIYANTLDPGWVPTKMGGAGAPDDLTKGYKTQTWLAVSNDEKAKQTGRYFYHQQEAKYNREADDEQLQERFLKLCFEITGIGIRE